MSVGPKRPPLRYFGSKWKLAKWIISYFPAHRIYVDAFGGGGSVLLRKSGCYSEVYNDLDLEVVNFFRVLQNEKQAARLRELLHLTPYAREEYALAWRRSQDPVERARRLIIRSFMGFGCNAYNQKSQTGFRSSANRNGTTPAHDWANYGDCLPAIIERFRPVVIENRCALEVIGGGKKLKTQKPQHDTPETLFYVDPPYMAETRGQGDSTGNKRHQYSVEFDTPEQHTQLAEVLHAVQGMVVLSHYPHPLYEQLYTARGWEKFEKKAYADGARERIECLWINPAAARALERERVASADQGNLFEERAVLL